MHLAHRKFSLGDRVRRDGSLGVFEVTRVFEDGSLVDIKHLDLCGPVFVERSVPARDLTFLSASRRPAIFVAPAPGQTQLKHPVVAASSGRRVRLHA